MCEAIELKNELAKYHIKNAQEDLLVAVNRSPGMALCELAKRLKLSKGTVSTSLKKLEEEHLIRKYPSPDNKRTLMIHPTKLGKDLYQKIYSHQIFYHS
ncbi:MarR family transcriptional regulator [uncultured Cetobacterium sp.]|uniref:MarR family transcriptional regulator n=1 Tax=uncultured Cetobacterium sp. TaxID=527638 RepID=UPI00262F81BA|nr:MarR family transcriptional regulator [uncultured Cetobacterium sp.]